MSDEEQLDTCAEITYTKKERVLFGLNAFPDQLTYQAFTILVFTYYYAVVGLNIMLVWAAFVIWGLWNSLNDPLLGGLSDRTKSKGKFGKRRFYLAIAIVPLSTMMVFLFLVPIGNEMVEFIYFVIVIMTFEFVYTMFSVNVNAVFPEMFPNEEERAKTNIFTKGFTLLAVIFASIIPTLIISPMVPLGTNPSLATRQHFQMMYITAGIVLMIIVLIPGLIYVMYGVKEKEETCEEFDKRPPFLESLKTALKNKTFLKFTLANMCIWYCFSTLLTILPLYMTFVVGIEEDAFLIGIALMCALLTAGFVLPLHIKLGQKIGMRNGLMLSLGLWIGLLFPFLFLGKGMIMIAIIIVAIQGLALGGCLFYVDILISDVIDEDALVHMGGIKRSASYYGVNAFVHRFSTIFSITTIALIFSGSGWSSYEPAAGADVILGLKLIIFVFPAIALTIAILFLRSFPLHGEKLAKMREDLRKLEANQQ